MEHFKHIFTIHMKFVVFLVSGNICFMNLRPLIHVEISAECVESRNVASLY